MLPQIIITWLWDMKDIKIENLNDNINYFYLKHII